MLDTLRGWPLLHSKLPKAALKALSSDVYGVSGLTDVNEGYLIQRLFAADVGYEWHILRQEFLGTYEFTPQGKNYTVRMFMASVHGSLLIEGKTYHGSGASDNRRLDAAFKGAATVAFKSACKAAGLTAELYLDGRAIDHIYDSAPKEPDKPAPLGAVQARTQSGVDLPAASEAPGPSLEIPADLVSLSLTLNEPWHPKFLAQEVSRLKEGTVRRRLINAHANEHGPACEHVAVLAGLKEPEATG